MGFYERAVLPRVIDKVCDMADTRPLRQEAAAGLRGEVVEIGFGSGLNLRHLPEEVDTLLAVDPSETGQRLAADRVARADAEVRFVGLDGAKLPLEDASVDAALSTFTLCTIPDVRAALAEVGRVLRPGGELHFLEHGRCPEPKVAKWQDRLTPIQKKLFGGCHFNRPIATLVEDSGLEMTTLRNEYVRGPRFACYLYVGVARKAGA